ncbi:MAG: hypothetical protein HOP32_05265 [Nitrospira sp.]|nr:hypothetical protein [Nitrospira sp.]
MREKLLVVIAALAALTGFVPAPDASAHIFYFDLQALGTQTVHPDGSTTYALTASLQGNGAWANATDADWGNSHNIPWYTFTVSNPEGANVGLSLTPGTWAQVCIPYPLYEGF